MDIIFFYTCSTLLLYSNVLFISVLATMKVTPINNK